MSIDITIECLPEPMLVFGSGKVGVDPRSMMTRSGAADKTQGRDIQIGLVGAVSEIEIARKWLPRLNMMAAAHEKNGKRYPDWPGAKHVFGVDFTVEDRFVRVVDQQRLEEILHSAAQVERFDGLLDLYDAKIQGLFGDVRPDCIIVCLPDEIADLRITNPRLSEVERMVLEKLQEEEESQQYSLFQPSPEELLAAEELRTQADDLLFRTFYRSLKARVITSANAVPIQVIRRDTFLRPDSEPGHSNATRCWNLGTSLFYKAGREPWRPSGLPRNTCFIGISFHHLKRREGDVVYASVAQAFSNEIEPFALKGSTIPRNQRRDKQPYLNKDQAEALINEVIDKYEALAGITPTRIVVHKTSLYQPEEEEGFRAASDARIPACDLVWIRSTALRLVRKGMQEPWRGTLCSIADESYLFTMGYVSWWREYPGPHIPAPIQIGSCGSTDVRQRAVEILALTKMNWNSSEGIGRYPITLSFARKVGMLMTELPDGQIPNPSYRFYM
jgi:hypothetical protein